jgi:2,3-bisphosphoglycerate-independent phosphoglycerate mutase
MKNLEKQFNRPKPVVLIVLDGWGIAQPYSGNAISQADTPNMNGLIARYPAATLMASGEAVGLPWGEVGNSEVGHLNLGLGRILYQELPRINKVISDNKFYKNEALLKAMEHAKKNNSQLHLLGLISSGCVHSSIEHLYALLVMAKEQKVQKVYIHAILDGRDTPYNSGLNFISDIERSISEYKIGEIATVSGRFYAMDRDNHWDRVEKAYLALTQGKGNKAPSALKAIEESYKNKIYDEEFIPTVIGEKEKDGRTNGLISENDSVIFFNYRADRAREITKAFVLPGFDKFPRKKYLNNLFFACFTEYEKDLPIEIAFPVEEVKNALGEVISKAGLKQLRIAESEKYAHVTYFFNGGKESKSEGETHELIPSARVASYGTKPEMSAKEITDKLLEGVEKNLYDFVLVNFANADMVGHTGNIKATVKAVETVDECVGKIVKTVLAGDGCVLITADHGNAENKFNMQTGTINKEHSANPVPLIIIGKQFEGKSIGAADAPGGDLSLTRPAGILSDVAPTILKIMNIKKPPEMTGRSLI